ncbi:MAG: hypothetical protein AAFO91_10715, partial [Bacteroidota bacterium]
SIVKFISPQKRLSFLMILTIALLVVWIHSQNTSYEQPEYVPPTSEQVVFWSERIAEMGGYQAYELFSKFYSESEIGIQHENAHFFGEALYAIEGIKGVVVCDARFAFGCYHSFFGFALLDQGLGILTDLDQACIEVYGRKGLGCQHGIGHGVLAELGYDKLDESLEACRTLDWDGPIGGCTSGVFMEHNFATMQDQGRVREAGEQGLHFPCNVVGNTFLEACYFDQPQWWWAGQQFSYERVGQLCQEAPTDTERTACYRGVGNLVAGFKGFELDAIIDGCAQMPDVEAELYCIEGASWLMAAQPEYEHIWNELCSYFEGDAHTRCEEARYMI